MTQSKFWTAIRKALTTMTVMLIVTFVLASGAAAEYKILYQFRMAKYGENPIGNLIIDAAGNLYGTTQIGGAYGGGTVFELSATADGGWKENILHNFGSGEDGTNPTGSLVFDAAGNLYGTTLGGGNGGGVGQECPSGIPCGTVFELSRGTNGSWTEKILHNFNGGGGAGPNGDLIFDAAGNLYGTTDEGGYNGGSCVVDVGCGTVFELTPAAGGLWNFETLRRFTGAGTDGWAPLAGLTLDASGNLYGTTSEGADPNCDCGAVFELSPAGSGSWTETILHTFVGAEGDGAFPLAPLTLDAHGNLYGTTFGGGGEQLGTVFELMPATVGVWDETVLHSFNSVEGRNPLAGLIFDAAGNLYGTTEYGGDLSCEQVGCGVVFELTPTSSGWSEKVLHTFTGYGKYPEGGVIMDADGTLYGTVFGGVNIHDVNHGFVFEILKNCIDDTFVMPFSGTLYLQQKGGEAGATTEFGVGTSPTNFVEYYRGLPNSPDPVGEVMVGSFTKGTVINFGMFTQFGTQSGWAFSSGSTQASVVAFSDVDDSLGMGGKIIQQTSPNTWLLHLDDALSYLYDDDDNDVLMQIRIVPQ